MASVCAAPALVACAGQIVDPPTPSVVEPPLPVVALPVVALRFPRLSHAEWELTVVDLFHLDAPSGLSASFAPDPLGGRVFDNNQAVLAVGPSLWRDYRAAAEVIAERVTSNSALLARIVPASLPSEPRAKASAFLESFGLRAFRRPLPAPEVVARRALFEQGASLYPSLDPFVAGVRLSIAAFLQSPHFVYRAELSAEPLPDRPASLDDWEIASRLSYAIWGSMPDDELFRAAGAHELSTAPGVRSQIERMLSTPRADTAVKRFFDQLYDADQYQNLSKSPALYPNFVPEVGVEMRTELKKFTANVFAQGGGVRELFTSTTTFVTPRLASLYGLAPALPAPDTEGFSRVELNPKERAGLLTRLGFLAWKGKESQPNTIQRGVFITRKIICQPLQDPPEAAQRVTFGTQPTNRERVEALTGPGTCGAGCHSAFINPTGYAFEHYGALGEFRLLDGSVPINSAATFPFQEGPAAFADAAEFSQKLAASAQVHTCFAGYLLEYLLGRERVGADAAFARDLGQRSLAGASLRGLFTAVLESEALRFPRTIEEVP